MESLTKGWKEMPILQGKDIVGSKGVVEFEVDFTECPRVSGDGSGYKFAHLKVQRNIFIRIFIPSA